jgi:hypothetical protein
LRTPGTTDAASLIVIGASQPMRQSGQVTPFVDAIWLEDEEATRLWLGRS